MSRLLRTVTPVVAFAAAFAAAWSAMTGSGDAALHAAAPAPDAWSAADATEPLFIAGRFEEQKRNAHADELPSQF